MMKKLIAILMAAVMILALTACSANAPSDDAPDAVDGSVAADASNEMNDPDSADADHEENAAKNIFDIAMSDEFTDALMAKLGLSDASREKFQKDGILKPENEPEWKFERDFDWVLYVCPTEFPDGSVLTNLYYIIIPHDGETVAPCTDEYLQLWGAGDWRSIIDDELGYGMIYVYAEHFEETANTINDLLIEYLQ